MRTNGVGRWRGIAALALATTAAGVLSSIAVAAGSPAPAPVSSAGLAAFVASLWPDAARQGIPRPLFDATLAALTPDPTVAALALRQPEFAKPTGAYLAAQVTAGRVATGRAMLERWAGPLAAIERRFGVPRAVVVAVWGLESNYGASSGTKDVIRSMATLGALDVRPALYRAELLAALTMLAKGEAQPLQLRGSWAGAMGQPQFMPSSFETYAVDGDGDGRRDIWGSVPDVLASIANFLSRQGWQPGRPWGVAVTAPAGFDLRKSRAPFADWTALGFARTDGAAMPESGEGILFFPAGATGPGFLVTPNFEVLKAYNFSDSYALSVGLLADRLDGGTAFRGTWPSEPSMSRDDRIALQARMAALGYPVDNREGRLSLALRDVIRTAQEAVGLPPDGNPTVALLRSLTARP